MGDVLLQSFIANFYCSKDIDIEWIAIFDKYNNMCYFKHRGGTYDELFF